MSVYGSSRYHKVLGAKGMNDYIAEIALDTAFFGWEIKGDEQSHSVWVFKPAYR